MAETKAYYSVSEVATMFGVSPQAVRDWLKQRKLVAIQPASDGGMYRIPVPAVAAMRRIRGEAPMPAMQTAMPAIEWSRAQAVYDDRIRPVLSAVSLGADEALQRAAAGDPRMAKYPAFATDYALYTRKVAESLRSPAKRPRSRLAGRG